MTTSIKEKIQENMKAAMRAYEKERLATIRLIMAAIKQREIDELIQLNDDQIIATLNKMLKQRRDSITQFEAGKRQDLADKEKAEVVIIQEYLPTQLDDAAIEAAVTKAIRATGATSAKDMGKVMGVLKAELHNKADMTLVSKAVKAQLTE